MGDQVETIEVRRVHDNDKYIITRKIVEEATGAELVKIYVDIDKAYVDSLKQLNEIPKQVQERTKMLEASLETLKERKAAFAPYASKLGAVKPEEPEPEPDSAEPAAQRIDRPYENDDAPAPSEEPKGSENGN